MEAELFWDGGGLHRIRGEHHPQRRLLFVRPYEIPNIKTELLCVYTNLPSAGRCGLRHAEIHWGIEQQMDILAEKLGMDPVAFRRKKRPPRRQPGGLRGPMRGATSSTPSTPGRQERLGRAEAGASAHP
jgi:CO/xanthine dehydrogenase Mo-binding subunit